MSEREGAARWLTIHDDLLRGMTHALSNRVATIMAASTLLEITDAASHAGDTLRSESERLEALLQTMRQLPRRRGHAPEPIMPDDIARGAIGLHEHHPEGRDVVCVVELDGDVPPAWAEPGALQLAITAALVCAKRLAGSGGRALVRISGTDDVVRFDVRAARDPAIDGTLDDETTHGQAVPVDRETDADAAAWLLTDSNGTARAHAHGIVVEVPTLGAARRARGR